MAFSPPFTRETCAWFTYINVISGKFAFWIVKSALCSPKKPDYTQIFSLPFDWSSSLKDKRSWDFSWVSLVFSSLERSMRDARLFWLVTPDDFTIKESQVKKTFHFSFLQKVIKWKIWIRLSNIMVVTLVTKMGPVV